MGKKIEFPTEEAPSKSDSKTETKEDDDDADSDELDLDYNIIEGTTFYEKRAIRSQNCNTTKC